MKIQRIRGISDPWVVVCVIFAALSWVAIAGATRCLQDRLLDAAKIGNVTLVKALLDKGADANAQDHDGQTALTEASYAGHLKVVKLLLTKGADVDSKTNWGDTALMVAIKGSHDNVVRLLLDAGADVNAKNDSGMSALMFATLIRPARTVKLLLDAGADVNAKDKAGKTALMNAALAGCMGKPDVVKLLLIRGADIKAKDSRGMTALRLAETARHKEVLRILNLATAYDGKIDRGQMGLRLAREGRLSVRDARPYPDTPAGVVEEFLKAALAGTPIAVEEMRFCTEVIDDAQCDYGLTDEDIEARPRIAGRDLRFVSGPDPSRLHITTAFEIVQVKKDNRTATVKVLFKRLGWIQITPLGRAKCRRSIATKTERETKPSGLIESVMKPVSKRERLVVWGDEECRILHVTNDQQEVTYNLLRPGKYWRIIGPYQPRISLGSAIKCLECALRHVPGMRKAYPSEAQRKEIRQDIRILQKHLTK